MLIIGKHDKLFTQSQSHLQLSAKKNFFQLEAHYQLKPQVTKNQIFIKITYLNK